MGSSLPTLTPPAPLTPLQSYDQQNLAALQDSLSQYSAAAASGIPGTAAQASAAQAAINSYGVSPPSTATTPSNTTSPSILSTAQQAVQSALHPGSALAAQASLYAPRLIFLILGIILFAAGLFAFKSTQTTIQAVTSGTKKVAALAGA